MSIFQIQNRKRLCDEELGLNLQKRTKVKLEGSSLSFPSLSDFEANPSLIINSLRSDIHKVKSDIVLLDWLGKDSLSKSQINHMKSTLAMKEAELRELTRGR